MANSLLVKINQIGTLTETIEAVEMAKSAGWTTVMSHRSGETEDSVIADLAVGQTPDKLKLVLCLVQIGLLSTINCYVSKKCLVRMRFIPDLMHFITLNK